MESLNIFIRSIFIDNMVFAFFFGMCSYIAVSKSVKTALGLGAAVTFEKVMTCLIYTSPSPRDGLLSRMTSSA